MRKLYVIILAVLAGLTAMAQGAAPQWTKTTADVPSAPTSRLVSQSDGSIIVNLQVPGFFLRSVATPKGDAVIVSLPKAISTAEAGEPDVPMVGIPTIIGNNTKTTQTAGVWDVRVLEAKFMDFEGVDVAPSKGDFPRSVDPATVPYTYGECYSADAFFPANSVELHEPYTMRDFRGQNMALFPFAYNPARKTLRVYYDMTVEMYRQRGEGGVRGMARVSGDFGEVYARRFINYGAATAKYTPVSDEGDLLIICHDEFMDAMADFVAWKKTRGLNTTIVGTSVAGTTSDAIKAYITAQYNANNNLTHVLLVGDVQQIPGMAYTAGSSYTSYSGKGDNQYGQIVGNDLYNDLFIGRFPASTVQQVETQVKKVITYERDLTTSDTWCQNGMGVSTKEDGNGHNNEDDYQHIDNIRTKLLDYGYNTVYQEYYHVSGYPTSSVSTISEHINSGVGVINYCNHGDITLWASHTPNYTVSHVNKLTNDNKLPFIFSTACLNGKYDHSSDCFAEAWMHATDNQTGEPTGAVGTLMSYISQPWVPPMWAQDEFADIIVESYADNKKRTWGGAAINACLSIFDHYSASNNGAKGTYQSWILFGDPSLMLRTTAPQAMTVSHSENIMVTDTAFTVTVDGGEGALATLTDPDHNILGRATVANGKAIINLTGTLPDNSELTVCVFGYNKATSLSTVKVMRQGVKSDKIFAYQDGDIIVVVGDGDLTVYDLAGRQLSLTPVSGVSSLSHSTLGIGQGGVYVLNLDGQSQKMVIKK